MANTVLKHTNINTNRRERRRDAIFIWYREYYALFRFLQHSRNHRRLKSKMRILILENRHVERDKEGGYTRLNLFSLLKKKLEAFNFISL